MSDAIIALLAVSLIWAIFFAAYFYFDSRFYRKAYRETMGGWDRSIRLTKDLVAFNQKLREYIFKKNFKITVRDEATSVIRKLQDRLRETK